MDSYSKAYVGAYVIQSINLAHRLHSHQSCICFLKRTVIHTIYTSHSLYASNDDLIEPEYRIADQLH